MFKRIMAGVLSTVICSSALTSRDLNQSAWSVTTGAANDAQLDYDENIQKTEDNTSVKTTIKAIPDESTIIDTEILGENITAYFYSNGLLRICGYGEMSDFKKSPFKNAHEVKQILFEDKDYENGLVITSIGKNVFSGMSSLNCSSCGSADKAVADLIVLPDSITSIGENAFNGCSDITAVIVPESVEEMGVDIFKNCKALKELTLPYAATSREVANGGKISSQTSVADLFTYYVTDSINKSMYSSDYTIEKITITGGECIPEYAFSGMKTVKEIDLSGTKASSINSNAFYNCESLESLKFPSTMKSIGSSAFRNCIKMEEFNLNDGLVSIGEGAFQYCTGLHSLTIPETVDSMGSKMLYECRSLETLTLPYAAASRDIANGGKTNSGASVADLFMYSAADPYNERMDFKPYSISKIIITGGQLVPDNAFSNMIVLKEIDLSGTNVTSIGSYAFWNCSDLASVRLPKTVKSIGNYAYYGNPIKELPDNGSITTIGDHAFASCQNLSEFTIPESYNSFGKYAFHNCKGIKKLVIPSNVTSIGEQIFNECTNLSDLTLPYAATSMEVANSGKTSSQTSVADLFFYSVTNLDNSGLPFSKYAIEKITITGGDCIPKYAFSGMTTIKEIDLSSTKASSIDSNAFNNCVSLESLKLPSTIESIGSYAFRNCTEMKEFNLNDGLKNIGESTFQNCTGLHSLTIPETVTSMGKKMLNGCFLLETLTLPYAATSWEAANDGKTHSDTSVANLFMYAALDRENEKADFAPYAISKINITGGDAIPQYAFSGMTTLKEVEIYDSEVASIDEYAFNNCTELVSIEIPEDVNDIKANAFLNSNPDIYLYSNSCKIIDKAFSENYSGTIYCYDDSTAKSFAISKDYKFVSFDNEVVIGPKNISMIKDDQYTIKSNYTNLNYSTSDSSVATVDKNGVISAVKSGNAVIDVKASDGKTGTVNVGVRVPATTTTTTTTTTTGTTTTTIPGTYSYTTSSTTQANAPTTTTSTTSTTKQTTTTITTTSATTTTTILMTTTATKDDFNWTDETSLPKSGVHKLVCDVTLSSPFKISEKLDLDLNGHTIKVPAIICDENSGVIIRDNSEEKKGAVISTSSFFLTVSRVSVKMHSTAVLI